MKQLTKRRISFMEGFGDALSGTETNAVSDAMPDSFTMGSYI